MKTGYRLSRWCMIALAFAMVVVLGCVAPVKTAEAADVYEDSRIVLLTDTFEYGDSLSNDKFEVEYTPESGEWSDRPSVKVTYYDQSAGVALMNADCGTYTVTIESADDGIIFGNGSITRQIKIVPKVVKKFSSTIGITYGTKLADVSPIIGECTTGDVSWAENAKNEVPEVPGGTYTAVYTPDQNHVCEEGWNGDVDVTVNVRKQVLTEDAISWPTTGLAMTYGDEVSSIQLPDYDRNYKGTFTWAANSGSDEVGVGTHEFEMTFTLSGTDAQNYCFANNANSVTKMVTVTINQRVITTDTLDWPEVDEVTYGTTFGEISLNYDPQKGDNKYGSFAWHEGLASVMPDVYDTVQTYNVAFRLNDTTNCRLGNDEDTLVQAIPLTVNPAELSSLRFEYVRDNVPYNRASDYYNILTTNENATVFSEKYGSNLNKRDFKLSVTNEAGDTVSEVTDAGLYTVTAEPADGNLNFTGSATYKFRIKPLTLDTLTLYNTSVTYDTGNHIDDIIVTSVTATNGTTVDSSEYSLSVKLGDDVVTDVTNAGEYTVVATAKEGGNYTGSATATFTVNKAPMNVSGLWLKFNSGIYTGEDFLSQDSQDKIIVESVTATNGTDLDTSEYTLSVKMSNNPNDTAVNSVVDVGSYYVFATAKGDSNFTGYALASFAVLPARVSSLTLTKNTSVYNGDEVDLGALANNVVLKANNDKVVVPSGTFTVRAYSGDSATNPATIKDAGTYYIKVNFVSGNNFTLIGFNDIVEYTVTPAMVSSIVLDPSTSSSVYTGMPVRAESLKATVYATDGIKEFKMPESAYNLTFPEPEQVNAPGPYKVYVALKDKTNYYKNGDGPSADYEVTEAPVTSFELTTKESTYNEEVVDLASLGSIVQAKVGDSTATLVYGTDYELVVNPDGEAMNIQDVGTYTIGLKILSSLYADTSKRTCEYKVNPLALSSFELADDSKSSTYDRNAVAITSLSAVVQADTYAGTITLKNTDYKLTYNGEIKDANKYVINIEVSNPNFVNSGNLTAEYTVNPAPVASFALTTRSSVYDGNEVSVGDLSATVTAGDNGDLTLEDGEFALKNSGANPIKDADSYDIGFELKSDNFTVTGFNGPFTDIYTVNPAPLFGFSLDEEGSVYDRNTVDPNNLQATVTAGETGALTLDRSDFELTCAETIQDAKTYDIGIAKLNNTNYTMEGTVPDATLPYTVYPAPVESVAVNPGYSYFNQEEVALGTLSATVKANGLTLNDNEYTLTCDDQILNVGSYTVGLADLSSNFSNDNGVTGIYEVKAATVIHVELTDTTSTYDQEAVAPEGLNAVVKALAGSEEITLDPADYTLVCDTEIRNAGTYSVGIALNTGNYVNPSNWKDTYTVTKATLSGVELVQPSSVYDQEAVDPAMLTAIVRATCDSGEIILPAEAYTLTCAETIRNVGEYTIGVALVDTNNYAANDSVVAQYTVAQATVSSVALDETGSIYSQEAVDPASLTATVKAMAGDKEITLPVDAYTLVCEESIVDAGTYAIGIALTDTNYTDPDHCTDTYTVTPAQLEQLTLGVSALIYDQQDVDLSALKPTVTAQTNGGKLITLPYGDADAAYAVVFNGNATDATVKNAGEYTLEVALIDDVNYAGAASAVFTVTPAALEQLTLGVSALTYDQQDVDLTALQPTVTAQANNGEIITLPYGGADAAYAVVFNGNGTDAAVKDAGAYKLEVELLDTRNYVGAAEATFTVNPAALHELTLGVSELIYNQKEVDLTALQPTATAEANDGETITLPYGGADAAYEIVFNGNQTDSIVMNAGEYALEVKLLDTRNYAGETSAIFTVAPATLEQLTLGVTTLIYDQEDVDLAALQPTVTARTNGGEIITLPYGGADTAYAVVFNGDASNATVRNAGTYKLEVKLTDARNYAGTAAADFVVTPAKVKQLTLGVKQSVYDRNAVDLTMLEPTVTAVTNGDAIITLPYGDEDAAYYIDGVEAVQVGDYVFGVKLIDQLNYEADTEITDTYAILRMPVAPLSMAANVTNSDGEYVLGGPVSEGHRTITIKGEPNELVYVVANGAVQSDLLKLNESGVATLTVDGNGTAGKLALGEKAELVLDGSGLGQAFALTVAYEDAANLRDGKEEAAPAQPQASYRYDMEAVTVEVAQLNNRSAQGVVVSLPEDLAEIAFASRSNAQIPFSGSRSGLVKGDAQVIGFNGTNKLNSTELDGNSVYDVTYTDLVGNTGAVVDQTVNKSGGTLKIDAVDPALNSNKRIGNTNKLTWTITCSFGGSSEEKASLTIGNKTFNRVLKNGVNTVEINAGDISSGTLLNVSAKFEDLSASATFESFVYDAKCETPVLTSMLYSECYVLTGMVEPGSRIVLRVNNERVDCKIDSFGTFAANMPVVYEGDKIEVVVTDLADNVTVKSFVVGPALELVQMKAYMMGKVYTNADKVQEGEEPDWTTITTVTKDELKTGKVNLPIVAGNMIQVGTMTMSMDDKGGISYDYELNEGVVLVSEDVRVYTTRSKEDSMAHTGVLLTRGETTQVPNKKNQYYVTAEFVVEVEANQLTTTFQLESAAESDLKMEYRDRQNNKPLK